MDIKATILNYLYFVIIIFILIFINVKIIVFLINFYYRKK